jgi:hypothetical protein
LKNARLSLLAYVLLPLIFVCPHSLSQTSAPIRLAGREATVEPRTTIDFPTAGVLPKSTLSSAVEFFQDGGVLVSLSFGLFTRFDLGISYGGGGILGSNDVTFNKTPGVNLKLRILDETARSAAIAIGFDSQGRESYIDSTKRYTIKSPGFFLVASKNYSFLGYVSIHGGLNYSLERSDGDKDPSGFFGMEKTLGPSISLLGEYNLGTNDDGNRALGRGRGYLNLGLRWALADGFVIGFDFKDLLKNQPKQSFSNRVLRLEYARTF